MEYELTANTRMNTSQIPERFLVELHVQHEDVPDCVSKSEEATSGHLLRQMNCTM